MEYFIGAISTLIVVNVVSRMIRKYEKKTNQLSIKISQSRAFELTRQYIGIILKPKPLTQAMRHYEEGIKRVLYLEDKAYWIENNQLFEAQTYEDGMFDENNAVRVDTMGMNDVELKRTIFIVEKLREGLRNDFGYTGDQGF